MDVLSGPVQSKSHQQTRMVGKRLGRSLQSPVVVALYGELGAGKTCFAQGVARGLEIKQRVISPTYTLINEYPGSQLLIHIDCYRLVGVDDAVSIGMEEVLSKTAVVVVEWPEKIELLLPRSRLEIRLEIIDETTRLIYGKRL